MTTQISSGYCDSDVCTNVVVGVNTRWSPKMKKMIHSKKYKKLQEVKKNVSIFKTFCPDCGSALFWKREAL